jgi:hypothetical protein
MDRIHLVQDRDQWRDIVNTAVTSRLHKMLGISRLAKKLLTSYQGLGSTESVNKIIKHLI